ncbi:MAG: inositol monophosphatase [Bacteroidetes bacterium GWF2_33_16]|nr:MAG: inositol monophosphatase [Bacteroidetes bacterium GWE2_32_14]OFY07851.1 MAG: inositol monophosphatase [Bacteroidetes bacterium GWF2_33_16]
MNLEHICNQVCSLSKEVGLFIKTERTSNKNIHIEVKGIHDFVTYVDKTAEQKLVDGLSKILPEAGYIAEENTSTKKGEKYNWIIDPLDGTTNFIHGLPPYAISIALMENDQIILGVVYEISLDECFYAWHDSPAFLNGEIIKVSDKKDLKSSLIATGFPYYDYKRIKPFLESLEFFMVNSHGVRRLGSAATDLVYVACGRFEAFYEYSLSPWDVAAGAFIVQQAGGKVSDFKGEKNYIFGKEIVACNNFVFDEFLVSVKQFMER